jgi:hypothetical protein
MDLKLTIRGTQPLLMHNAQLADPLNPMSKALKGVTSKVRKSDDDHLEMARLEFMGGLYIDPDPKIGPFIPGDNIFRMLIDSGRKRKLGKKVTEGVFITTPINPLAYTGPRDAEGLWAAGTFSHRASAKVGMQRVNRTRPIFRDWVVDAEVYLDTEVLDLADLESLVQIGGKLIGLGDWRPIFGRFEADLIVTGTEN